MCPPLERRPLPWRYLRRSRRSFTKRRIVRPGLLQLRRPSPRREHEHKSAGRHQSDKHPGAAFFPFSRFALFKFILGNFLVSLLVRHRGSTACWKLLPVEQVAHFDAFCRRVSIGGWESSRRCITNASTRKLGKLRGRNWGRAVLL